MKRVSVGILAMLLVLCTACSRWSNDDEQFVLAYTEVLITREQYPDTALANRKVAAVLKQHGFTESSFRKRFQDLTSKPDRLRQILDSARNRARRIADDEQRAERVRDSVKAKSDSAASARGTNTIK
jgi:hypothetical protein